MADTWQVRAGSKASWDVAINTGLDPVTQEPIPIEAGVFTAADTPAATVWAGRDRPALLTPAAAWVDDSTCVAIRVAFRKADTLALAPAFYPVDVQVLPAGGLDPIDVASVTLQVLAAPGSTAAGRSYATLQDLQDWAPWILTAEDLDVDLAGFARQLERATSWLDDVIVALWKPASYQPTIGQPGYGAWLANGFQADAPESVYLRGLLDGGALLIRDKTRELVACKAIGLVCLGQVADKYRRLGREYSRRASSLLKTYRAEIDPDSNGYASIIVHCGSTNLR